MTANARLALATYTESQSTEHLITAMLTLDGKAGEFLSGLKPEEVIALHAIEEVLLARFPKAEAKMDEWFENETEAGIQFITDNSYAALVALAIDQTK